MELKLRTIFICSCLVLAGCVSHPIQDCDFAFFGAYQDYPEPKVLVSGAPKNLFTKKEYMGRCVPVVAVTGDQTVAQLTNTAMSQCEQELVQYNGTDKAKNMICLVYAKNDQRMPWVAEMQAAWKEGRRTDAENDRIIELAISSTTNAMSLKTPDSRYIPVSK